MQLQHDLLTYWQETYNFCEQELSAFKHIDRALFVPEDLRNQAYDDTPLPLLRGKTISQPTTVMIMTHALELKETDNVFEVGTGSGYQAAIIASIARHVTSAEVIPELVTQAQKNIGNAGIRNIKVLEEDGSKGHAPTAPYDKIIITAACKEFPKELIEQLKTGGIIVGPVGNRHEQELVKATKQADGSLALEFLGAFIFTPMYGKYGFEI